MKCWVLRSWLSLMNFTSFFLFIFLKRGGMYTLYLYWVMSGEIVVILTVIVFVKVEFDFFIFKVIWYGLKFFFIGKENMYFFNFLLWFLYILYIVVLIFCFSIRYVNFIFFFLFLARMVMIFMKVWFVLVF